MVFGPEDLDIGGEAEEMNNINGYGDVSIPNPDYPDGFVRQYGLLCDEEIQDLSFTENMIRPFSTRVDKGISYGLSSYGYDARVGDKFEVFAPDNFGDFTLMEADALDPKAFRFDLMRGVEGNCIIPPNSFALSHTVETFKLPRDILAICLGKSTYARCFSGDTKVALVDGRSLTFEKLVRASEKGERFWGYGIDLDTMEYRVTELDRPRYVEPSLLVEITLDDGQKIKCTPDHEFLRHNNRGYTAAKDLRPGDGLVPLYRNTFWGRESVWIPQLETWLPTHWLSDMWNIRHNIYEELAECHRHHVDGNKADNRPINIQRILASEHVRQHNSQYYGKDFDGKQHGETIKDAFTERRKDADWKANFSEQQSKRAYAFWHDPKYAEARAKLSAKKRGHNHKIESIRPLKGEQDTFCLTSIDTGNFALDAGVITKNCGIIINVTPLEPEWEGQVTIEISNTTPYPAKIYAGEGICQFLFFRASGICKTSYADRKGKYQSQRGIVGPR